ALGEWRIPEFSQEEATAFLQAAIIAYFDLLFHQGVEEQRYHISINSMNRIRLLFDFILTRMPLDSFKDKLVKEIEEISAQRPIITTRLQDMLRLIRSNFKFDPATSVDQVLAGFVDALFYPTALAKHYPLGSDYQVALAALDLASQQAEAEQMADAMKQTGLVSAAHLSLLQHLNSKQPDLIPVALGLSSHGKAEFERHQAFVQLLIENFLVEGYEEVIYGLSRLLNRNLLSRRAVNSAFKKLLSTSIHPEVRHRLLKGHPRPDKVTAQQLIVGGMICLLGQPLGVGQGMNPTCQSARGLSMWSGHSPGKLLNMVVTAVAANELNFRFQGELITSSGIVNEQTFDFNLDPVSIVLVPHLDNIYQQMMQKAQLKFPTQDPHITVNPSFYGLWIPTGFISCYNQVFNVIQDYNQFVRLFYANFHPDYNGGFNLTYPLPLGIFITASNAQLLGFHAISLLRVNTAPDGILRAYFFNPNNDGRQNWGQGILPTVAGNGERFGESSLPFHQFVSRVYAFHYNTFEAEANLENEIPDTEMERVRLLAQESWGKKYFWD
ncbi:MAG: hypothetical protein KDC44_10850, partial [Phaeodactylibacter sp.]|nr:hypothetical protein [Phaeodactylibacter sp.]